MQWYYASEGKQHGPVGEVDLRELIRADKLDAESLVWREGMGDWQPLGKVDDLATALATPESEAVPDEPEAGSPYQPPAAPVGQPVTPAVGQDIPNYLWQSIVVALLCSPIFGIIAIVYAAKVDSLKRAGNLAAAQDASKKAKMWCWVAVGVSIVVTGLLMAVGAFGEASGNF